MIRAAAIIGLLTSVLFMSMAFAQPAADAPDINIAVVNELSQPLEGATVELFTGSSSKPVKATVTNNRGIASFKNIAGGSYSFLVTNIGYQSHSVDSLLLPSSLTIITVKLMPVNGLLQGVNIRSKKPYIQHIDGKTILNIDAAVTNTGTTVLEVLDKSPGVTVDRNGGISLQGKANVLVMIDDKPTYLSGAELNNLLSSMSSSQVENIELMTNPPAKYDASGNAGIINIKTKKNKTKGFNGSFTVAAGHGKYPKNSNSLLLNYRTGKFNTFLTYSMNFNKYLTDIYALRKYYDNSGNVTAILDQPTYFSGTVFNNSLKTGIDYYLSAKTTLGIVLSGTSIHRKGSSDASATWLDGEGNIDSAVATTSSSDNHFRNGAINLNARHSISSSQDISVDVDWLGYDIRSEQYFNSELITSGGYTEASKGTIPSIIQIVSGKADHILHMGKNGILLSGFKSSHISTDNTASYQNFEGSNWSEDYGKSNHFLYKENIYALYSSIQTKQQRLDLQAGLRYEYTSYDAHQLGNVLQKDSAFSRNYGGLFPSGTISYQVDSSNSFSFTAGRRIDRPAFQKLNPFFFIINKYTYQTGNPYMLPQFSWNLELSHRYKELLTTTVSYSRIKNYFSQLFLSDTVNDILFYSEGNVGSASIFGLSATLVISPVSWWSLTTQANYNYKLLKGFNGNQYATDINQLNINCNNQFKFAKIYTAELSGFYTTRARNDLQELLYPTGQLSIGVARPIMKKKGNLKLSARDIFYTNAMEGLTQFAHATEYFIVRRDSRVVNLAFTYRFGKAYKSNKRSGGSAADEIERVGSGG